MMNKGVLLITLIITIIVMIIFTSLLFEAAKQERKTKQNKKAIVYIGNEEKIIDVEWYYVSQAGVATIRAKDGKEYQTTNYTIITRNEEYD